MKSSYIPNINEAVSPNPMAKYLFNDSSWIYYWNCDDVWVICGLKMLIIVTAATKNDTPISCLMLNISLWIMKENNAMNTVLHEIKAAQIP